MKHFALVMRLIDEGSGRQHAPGASRRLTARAPLLIIDGHPSEKYYFKSLIGVKGKENRNMMRFRKTWAFLLVCCLLLGAAAIAGAEGHVHKWSAWEVVHDPTCTDPGTSKRTCSEAGCPLGGVNLTIISPLPPATSGEIMSLPKLLPASRRELKQALALSALLNKRGL